MVRIARGPAADLSRRAGIDRRGSLPVHRQKIGPGKFLPFEMDRPMGQVRSLDEQINQAGYLRLTTCEPLVTHMGNQLPANQAPSSLSPSAPQAPGRCRADPQAAALAVRCHLQTVSPINKRDIEDRKKPRQERSASLFPPTAGSGTDRLHPLHGGLLRKRSG